MEHEFDVEAMKKMKKTVEKCLAELTQKNDLTPQETKAALDGGCLYDWLCEHIEEAKMEEEGEYSERRGSSRRSYRSSGSRSMRGSYGDSMMYPERSYAVPVAASSTMYPERSYAVAPMAPVAASGTMYPERSYAAWGGYSGYPGYPSEFMNESFRGGSYDGYSDAQKRGRDGRYSRHSIGDRVISMMEQEMDEAKSEYEKEQLHKFIRMIRAAADEV